MKAIVAIDKLWGIGKDGKLLFKIKEDMKFFKTMTENKVVVMGHRAFKSLPDEQPLKNRINLVITSDKTRKSHDNVVFGNLNKINDEIKKYDTNDIFIIGGESIYNEFIHRCDTVYVTHNSRVYNSDTYMTNLAFEGFIPERIIDKGIMNDNEYWRIEEWVTSESNSYKFVLWFKDADNNTLLLYCDESGYWRTVYYDRLRVLTNDFKFKLSRLELNATEPMVYKVNNFYRAEMNRHCNYDELRIAAFGSTEKEAIDNFHSLIKNLLTF